MKINTGNFGNNGTQLGQVGTRNPEVLSTSQAEQSAADSTIRAQDTVQQGYRAGSQAAANRATAWTNVGAAVAGIGQGMIEHAQALARQKAELQLQDYNDYRTGQMQELQQQMADGRLDSAGFKDAYAKIGDGWKGENIQDLTGSDRLRLDKGMQTITRSQDKQANTAYSSALHVERINAADQTVAGYSQQILQPGADIASINGRVDEFFNRADTKSLYGSSWGGKYHAAKQGLQSNYFQAQIEANNSNNPLLEQLRGAVTSNVDDPKTRTSLLNAIDSKQSRNEARAQAAQNHADSVATRREMSAVHADDQMQVRIANGEIPTDADWNKYENTTDGTSVGGGAKGLKIAMATTQELLKNPVQAQQILDARKLQLDQHGGSATDYKVYNAVQRGIDQRLNDVKNDPQRVGAMDANEPLANAAPADALTQPGVWGANLQTRLVNSNALVQKYGPTAGKDLLTKDEQQNTQDLLRTMTPDQRVQFWRNTTAAGGPEVTQRLATQLGGDSLTTSAVAGLAGTKDGYAVAAAVERGNELLRPTNGAAKVTFDSKFSASLISNIKSEYPTLTPAQVQQMVPVVTAYQAGIGKDSTTIPSGNDFHAIIGTPTKVAGSSVIVPPGVKENVFLDTMNKGISRLGGQAQSVRNGLNSGLYSFATDASGNQVLYNTQAQRPIVGQDGRPIVIEVNK